MTTAASLSILAPNTALVWKGEKPRFNIDAIVFILIHDRELGLSVCVLLSDHGESALGRVNVDLSI